MSIELGENQRVTQHQIGGFRNQTNIYSVDGEVKVVVDELNIPDVGGVTSEVQREIYKVREDGLIENANSKTDFAGSGDADEVYSHQRQVIETVEDEFPAVMEFNELDSDIRNLLKGNIVGSKRKVIEKQRLPDGNKVRFLQDKKGIRTAVVQNSESDEILKYRKGSDDTLREIGKDPSGPVPDKVKYKVFAGAEFESNSFEVEGRFNESWKTDVPNISASNLRRVLNLESLDDVLENRSATSNVLNSYLEQNPERKKVYRQLASEARSLPPGNRELKESLESEQLAEIKKDFDPLREYTAEIFRELKNEKIPEFVYSDTEEVANNTRQKSGIEDDEGNLWYVTPEATRMYGNQILDGFDPRKVDTVVDNSQIEYRTVRSLLEEGVDDVNLATELDY